MAKDMNEVYVQIADANPAATIVGAVFGAFCGGCTVKVLDKVIESLLPEPVTIAEKIVTGVGVYSLGAVVGLKAEQVMETQMKQSMGALVSVKSGINVIRNISDINVLNVEKDETN